MKSEKEESLGYDNREYLTGRTRMNGVQKIAAERMRQIEDEKWTPEHDDEHDEEELASAAVAYAWNNPDMWPWESERWKPSNDPIRNLVKAGALIAAEIDRLERKAILDLENKQL
jgi:hypothetical protein